MPTVEDCQKCTKPCPQAKLAHDTAVGRMYATNELIALLKKLECGQLVEVVRCGDCKHYKATNSKNGRKVCYKHLLTHHPMLPDDFCSRGERKDGEG